jgi:signal transduction histidine kinase
LGEGNRLNSDEDLKLIQGATADMRRMLNDMLDVTSAILGRFSVVKSPHRVDQLLADATDALKPTAQTKNITLHSFFDDDLPNVLADADRLHQVFASLGYNAIRFTPPGGRVTLRATRSGDVVLFEVSDTGPGIAAASLAGVFDRVQRSASGSNGMGLGLAIAKAVVEAHGGRIRVTSEMALGTTFHFSIPIERPPSADPIGLRAPTRAE